MHFVVPLARSCVEILLRLLMIQGISGLVEFLPSVARVDKKHLDESLDGLFQLLHIVQPHSHICIINF